MEFKKEFAERGKQFALLMEERNVIDPNATKEELLAEYKKLKRKYRKMNDGTEKMRVYLRMLHIQPYIRTELCNDYLAKMRAKYSMEEEPEEPQEEAQEEPQEEAQEEHYGECGMVCNGLCETCRYICG